jgi:hypothetical protein
VATQAALTRVIRGERSVGVGLGADVGGASFGVWGREEVGSVVTISASLKIPFGSVGADDLRTPTGHLGSNAARSTPDPIVRPTRSPCNGRRVVGVQAGRVCAPGPDAGRGTRRRQRVDGHDDGLWGDRMVTGQASPPMSDW